MAFNLLMDLACFISPKDYPQRQRLSFQVMDKDIGAQNDSGMSLRPSARALGVSIGVLTSWSGVLSIIVHYIEYPKSYISMHTSSVFLDATYVT